MMKRKIYLVLLTLCLAACVAQQETPAAPPPALPTPTSATVIPTNIPLTPTPAKKIVVKQNDLIFIEFFAVT
jgi:nitrous oxide reductase accessory protein NosL